MSADGDIQNNTSNTEHRQHERRWRLPAPAEEPTRRGRGQDRWAERPEDRVEDREPRPDQEAAKETSRRSEAQAAVSGGVLPNKAAEDDPRRWGDQPDNYDHDAWLQEQKPPHWG